MPTLDKAKPKHAPGTSTPPPLEIDHAKLREKWPGWLKDAFNLYGPASVWIGGSRDLVSFTVQAPDGTITRFGHNRLCRPVKFGVSESWRDTVTQRLNQTPGWWQGLLGRVWVPSDMHAKQLSLLVVDHFADVAELTQLQNGFVDIGPDADMTEPSQTLLRIAQANAMEAWDDEGLVAHLIRLDRARKAEELKRKQSSQRSRLS